MLFYLFKSTRDKNRTIKEPALRVKNWQICFLVCYSILLVGSIVTAFFEIFKTILITHIILFLLGVASLVACFINKEILISTSHFATLLTLKVLSLADLLGVLFSHLVQIKNLETNSKEEIVNNWVFVLFFVCDLFSVIPDLAVFLNMYRHNNTLISSNEKINPILPEGDNPLEIEDKGEVPMANKLEQNDKNEGGNKATSVPVEGSVENQ